MRSTLALGFLVVLTAGTWLSEAGEKATPRLFRRQPFCHTVDVGATPAVRQGLRVFRATHVLDLTFEASLAREPNAGEDPRVEMRLYDPNGHLYQAIEKPVSALLAPGKGHARTAPRASRLALPALAVAGTPIVNNSLYGLWRVEVWSGGSLGCSAQFKIKP